MCASSCLPGILLLVVYIFVYSDHKRERARDLLTYFRRRQILLSFIITTYCRTHFLAARCSWLIHYRGQFWLRSQPPSSTTERERASQQKLTIDLIFSLTFAKLTFFESHNSTSKEIGRLWNVLEYQSLLVLWGDCEIETLNKRAVFAHAFLITDNQNYREFRININ